VAIPADPRRSSSSGEPRPSWPRSAWSGATRPSSTPSRRCSPPTRPH